MAKLGSTLWLLGGVAAVGFVTWRLRREEAPPAHGGGRPPFVLSVTLGALERGALQPRAQLTGVVRSNQHARLGFELAGRIVELPVEEGVDVAEGALLAKLDDRDALAGLARARAQLERASRELDRTLAGEREEDKRRLAADLEARRAEEELARRDVERGRGLVADNVISRGELDAFEAAYTAASARVRSAQESLAAAQAGARAEEIAVAKAEVELRRSEVEVAERELAKTRLVAPFAGAVVRRTAALGDSVAAGQDVIELVDLAHREIEIDVPSAVAAQLEAKAAAHATLDEYPGVSLDLAIDALAPLADDATRHFRAIARFAPGQDPELRFKPGMFARVEVEQRPIANAWLAPSDALRVTPQGTIVVLARQAAAASGAETPPGLSAEFAPVRVLGAQSGRTAVAPLGPAFVDGDQVVVIGADMAFPGAPLAPRPSKSAAPEGASKP